MTVASIGCPGRFGRRREVRDSTPVPLMSEREDGEVDTESVMDRARHELDRGNAAGLLGIVRTLCDALDERTGERDAAIGAISKLLLWESDMVLALLAIERESEGHGDISSPSYDMTLDHICELATGARQGEGLDGFTPSELAAIGEARRGDG